MRPFSLDLSVGEHRKERNSAQDFEPAAYLSIFKRKWSSTMIAEAILPFRTDLAHLIGYGDAHVDG